MGIPLLLTLCFSLVAFRILSLSLNFAVLIIIYLGVDLFWFILFGTLYVSYTKIFVFLFRFGKLSVIISSNTFLSPSFSSPSRTPIMDRLEHSILSHSSLMLLSFFSFVFLSALQIGPFPLFCVPDHLFSYKSELQEAKQKQRNLMSTLFPGS